MSAQLDFVEDEALKKYYERIAAHMVSSFGISETEAFQRVTHFARQTKRTSSWLILHRSVEYWAQGIYYKHDDSGEITNEPKSLPPDD